MKSIFYSSGHHLTRMFHKKTITEESMVYDERLADRVRKVLAGRKGLTERKMFGGIAFMVSAHMCCGIVNDQLVVRVGPERYKQALAQRHARPMDFTGRPLKGFVFVARGGLQSEEALRKWILMGVDFISSMPRKHQRSH